MIGIGDEAFHQQVLDFLARDPRVDVVGAATSADRLDEIGRRSSADVTILCPTLAADRSVRPPSSAPATIVVAEEMTVPVLRDAIDIGAGAVVGWPEERAELVPSILSLLGGNEPRTLPRGSVVAVVGARGGAGATFVATQLARSFAHEGGRPVLVDVDHVHSDLAAALGVLPLEDHRTVLDLLPVLDELAPQHLEDALHRDERGFSVLLGPSAPHPEPIPSGLYRAAVGLLACEYDPVVVHLARAATVLARDVVELADRVVLVTTLDLFSLYGARRTLEALRLDRRLDRCCVVVNRASTSPIAPADVERVLGLRPAVVIRHDPRVRKVQERAELLAARARGAAADVRRLAALLRDGPLPAPGEERR